MFQRDVTQLTERDRRAWDAVAQRARDALTANAGNGRPPIELPPDVARAILNDVANGDPYSRIVERYRPVARFSGRWLRKALGDGRIERMAGAGQP